MEITIISNLLLGLRLTYHLIKILDNVRLRDNGMSEYMYKIEMREDFFKLSICITVTLVLNVVLYWFLKKKKINIKLKNHIITAISMFLLPFVLWLFFLKLYMYIKTRLIV